MKALWLVILLAISGCDAEQEVTAVNNNLDNEKVWVFAQFNVREEKDDLESYYYYAKISKSLYTQISENKLHQGFILLNDVKYWGKHDVIYNYEDGENSGQLVFRIEDIAKIDLVKVEPIVGKGTEQFETATESSAEAVNEALTEDLAEPTIETTTKLTIEPELESTIESAKEPTELEQHQETEAKATALATTAS